MNSTKFPQLSTAKGAARLVRVPPHLPDLLVPREELSWRHVEMGGFASKCFATNFYNFSKLSRPSSTFKITFKSSKASLISARMRRLRSKRYYLLTLDQPKITAYVLSCFVRECDIEGSMMQNHLIWPSRCGSPCCIVALSALAMSMLSTILEFCSYFLSGRVKSLW